MRHNIIHQAFLEFITHADPSSIAVSNGVHICNILFSLGYHGVTERGCCGDVAH